ncbi:DNA-binding transcriptional regulator, MerR family [Desulfotomaculum arcticum]|uniref:DNA-binding transcriptional regulator, MerR family n=1 Tax=Desulfotruncus arcticus DSM 17038 TaxID=1121424 RepID=A0A1I2SPB3_9FIRM|nr:MerR family transcriptional regulator [Desulfotruncus arcticus]SFG54685.1 DNA-binding transcriptional regulator, MerR family [Desulfotomaculum arcticum] [Desulfotruncus arcticus DSM 17038]
MKISEVQKYTGLTKKAINYYEQEGMIKPIADSNNNYRDYSQRDVDVLVQISVLRQFDIPIKRIKEIISNPEMLKDFLKQHLERLTNEARRIEKNRYMLQLSLRDLDSFTGLQQLTKHLSALNKAMEMDGRSKEGFMRSQLQRIFPGNFGKMLITYYSPFLNEPVNTHEKEEAWIKIVKFLDDIDDIKYSSDIKMMYEQLTEEDLIKHEQFVSMDIKKWINITEEELQLEKQKIINTIKNLTNNPEVKSTMLKSVKLSGELKSKIKSLGYYENFVDNLKVLSNNFQKYSCNRSKFIESLQLIVDDTDILEHY